MKKSTSIILSLVIIGIAIGIYFNIRTTVKYHKAIAENFVATQRLLDFVQVEFPDQISDYSAKLQAKESSTSVASKSATAPAPAK